MTRISGALRRAAPLLALTFLAATARAQVGGRYDLGWGAVADGGGIFSQGGSYRVGATIGQSDAALGSGGTYVLRGGFWSLRDRTWLAAPESPAELPRRMALLAGAPNPFHASTLIAFDLTATRDVRLVVYDVAGHLVRTLVRGSRDAGRHHMAWSGEDDGGRRAAPGLYFIRLDAGEFHASQRVVLLD